MKINKKISILGCGNGGMALAADLKLKGAEIALWADKSHSRHLDYILNSKNKIIFEEDNSKKTVQLDLVSNDFSEVVQFGDIIYNCTPMDAHNLLFNQIAACLKKNPSIKLLINLSGVFSGIDQFLNTQDKSIFDHLKVFDTSTFPYACRAANSNYVTILGRKLELPIAPLFMADINYLSLVPDILKPIKFHKIENSFKLGLMGNNAILHPATVLFNLNLIDKGASFQFYKEGNSQKTSLMHEEIDNERIALAKAMGYSLISNVQCLNKLYGTNFDDHYDIFHTFQVYEKVISPASLNHRFLTEDIAYGLVPLLALAKLYDLELSNITSMVQIFSTIMGVNYFQDGRNLAGLTREIIQAFSEPNYLIEQIVA